LLVLACSLAAATLARALFFFLLIGFTFCFKIAGFELFDLVGFSYEHGYS